MVRPAGRAAQGRSTDGGARHQCASTNYVLFLCARGFWSFLYLIAARRKPLQRCSSRCWFCSSRYCPLSCPCVTRPLTACRRNDCFMRVARKPKRLLTRGLPDGLSRMGRGERWARQHHGLGYLQRRQNPRGALVRGCPGVCLYGGGARMRTGRSCGTLALWHASFVGLLC